MTLIINALHNDFSLLVADRRANVEGPTTLRVRNVVINAAKGATITGFNKIYANASKLVAVGIAGDANQHGYLAEFATTQCPNEAISVIDSEISRYAEFSDRKRLIDKDTFPAQEGILSFFDNGLGSFFSLIYDFSWTHKSLKQYRAPDCGIHLHYRGSGGLHLRQVIDESSFDRLKSEVALERDYAKCLDWLLPIYEKISQKDPNVSDSLVAWVSLRSQPCFQKVAQ